MRKIGALFMLVGLLTGTFSAFGPRVFAEPINPGTLGNFENEGDQDDPTLNTGTIDWQTVKTDPRITEWVLIHDDNDPDTDDASYIDSAKEHDPSTWGCAANEAPPKDDIYRMYLASQITQASQYLHIGYVRATGTGDTDINLEFNQSSAQFSCPGDTGGRVRSHDDLMLSFTFGGGAGTSVIDVYRWDTTVAADYPGDPAPDSNDFVPADGHWDRVALAPNVAMGTDNWAFGDDKGEAQILDRFFDNSALPPRTFGEITMDLAATFGNLLDCPGTGYVSGHSRASHSFASDLKDILPEVPFDVSNCASLKIKKVDDLGAPMEGVQFGLFATEAHALAGTPIAQLPTNPPQDLICETEADGTCTFPKVPAGDYFINELNLPDGYTPDPDLPKAVHLDPFQDLDWSDDDNEACAEDLTSEGCEWFVNTLLTGTVEITKAVVDGEGDPLTLTDITYLDGITFELQDPVTHDTIQKRGGGDATCTLDLDDPGDDPSCTIDDVPFGTYDVVEDVSTLPAGLDAGPTVQVTVDESSPAVAEVTYENPADPLNISIDKTGNTSTANVGDTITYTFTVGLGDLPFDTVDDVDLQPLTSVAVTEVVSAPDYANRCTASALTLTNKEDIGPLGNSWLEAGERWTYQCTHVVTAAEAFDDDGLDLKNRAHVTGTDRYGRTAEDTDDHLVTILLPDLAVTKVAADGVDADGAASASEAIDAPGTASYTITVTNVGAGIARNATLTDTLPSGLWTVTLASPDGDDVCPVSGNPKSGSFTCTFGDLASGASKVVTVSRAVSIENDCAAVLENNAGVTTTYQDVDIDPNSANDSSSATITVRCPDVGVVKSADNSPINAGDLAEWTITVTNNGAGTATDVHLVDAIPLGLSSPAVGGPDGADCELVGNVVSCDFGDLAPNDGAPGGLDTRVITVSGLTDPADCGTVPNTATVVNAQGGDYVDTEPDNNASTASVVVQCPDVYVDKSGPAEVSAGDDITWSITFGNLGPGDAYDAVLTDELPDSLTGYQLTDVDGVCDLVGTTVTCTFEVLEAGAEHTISVTGTTGTTLEDCGDVVNPVSISASNEATGEVRENNTDEATTDVECPDVDLEKVADEPDTVSAGDPVGFTITVVNAEGEDVGIARDVLVTDTLPDIPGYVWAIDGVDADAEDPCELVGLELTCDFGDLSPGESASVHLVATQDGETDPEDACGTYPNTAVVLFGNGVEADDSNNSASVAILCPGLNLGKVADAAIVEAGDQIGFSITVSNIDDGEPPPEGVAADVVVVDELPGDLDWAVADDSDLPEGASCAIEAGVLTCELGDLPAIDGEDAPQVTIHVVADTSEADCGVYDNTATATVANGVDPDDADATSRVRCPISIDLDKTGDVLAHVGDTVSYEFTVTNTGGEDLLAVQLTDPECNAGSITLVDNGDGDLVLAAGTWDADSESFVGGEVWSYTCERTLTADDVVVIDGDDFALNTGSVRAEDADEREVTDTDPHVVEIITPVIDIIKTVDDDTPAVGQTVTFTYVVTNTGDTTLFDIAVVDDQLGPIGTIAELAVGASATLTETMVVAVDSPTLNVATATGEDVLGKSVTDDDDATITIVLGAVIVPPAALPRTGAESGSLLVFSGMLLLLGGLLVATGEAQTLRTARRRSS